MASLIDNIISLEKEADLIVEQAEVNSRKILEASEDEITRHREQLAAKLETDLARFRTESERRYQNSLADIARKRAGRLDALAKLPDDFIVLQAKKIIDRFNNW